MSMHAYSKLEAGADFMTCQQSLYINLTNTLCTGGVSR